MPIAIVTGGNSGIGRAITARLAQEGFDVGFTWHSEEGRAREAEQEIEQHGRRAESRHADLHDVEAAARTIDELADTLGGLDVLVNNAGYGSETPFHEMELEEWRGVIEVNLTGAFMCARTAARRMIDQGRGGRIINITSVHEHIPLDGSAPYTASKHGLGGFTKVAAMELGGHGITVNAVAPGQIATRMTGQEDREPDEANVPLGRAGTGHEIAGAVAFLAGADGTYVTGESIVIDGGLRLIAARHQ